MYSSHPSTNSGVGGQPDHGGSGQPSSSFLPANPAGSPLNVSSGVSHLSRSQTDGPIARLVEEIVWEMMERRVTVNSPVPQEVPLETYITAAVLKAMLEIPLAVEESPETTRELLIRKMGGNFSQGNLTTFLENALEASFGRIYSGLRAQNDVYAESAMKLTVGALSYPFLSHLLLQNSEYVQKIALQSAWARLYTQVEELLAEGKNIRDNPDAIEALISLNFALVRDGIECLLPSLFANPAIAQEIWHKISSDYSHLAARQYQLLLHGKTPLPSWVVHERNNYGATTLLEDMFLLASHNRILPEHVTDRLISQLMQTLQTWPATQGFYPQLLDPFTALSSQPVTTAINGIAEAARLDYPRLLVDTSASLSQAPERTNPLPDESSLEYYDPEAFWSTLFGGSRIRNLAALSIASLSAVTWFGLDSDLALTALPGAFLWVLHDRPQYFENVAFRIAAHAFRGAASGAFLAGLFWTSFDFGQLRFVLPIRYIDDMSFLTFTILAGILSEVASPLIAEALTFFFSAPEDQADQPDDSPD